MTETTKATAAQQTMMGTYELIRRLGVGGMGEVWLARQRGAAGFAREVAIKRLLPQAMEQQDVVNMFIEEAQVTGRLRHPNVVNVIELGAAESGELYLVLEFVDGTGLHKLLRDAETRPSASGALAIGRDIALALQAAHTLTDEEGKEYGLVHRDVTPSNVMIDKHGHIKLMDFGIAKVRAKSNQTEAGIIKGKIAYLAPEQLRGEVDPRSDLFALGLVMWEIIAGDQARSGSSDAVMMAKVALDQIPSIRTKRPDLPEPVIEVVDRACALDPNDRYQTGEELADAILKALPSLPTDNSMEAARASLSKAVKSVVKREGEAVGANTNASRTVDGDRRLAITIHSLVVQQGDLTISRPLPQDLLKAKPPPDARTSPGTQSRRRARSSALPIAAGVASLTLIIAAGVIAKQRNSREQTDLNRREQDLRAARAALANLPTPTHVETPPTPPLNPMPTVQSDAGAAIAAAPDAGATNVAHNANGRPGTHQATRNAHPNTTTNPGVEPNSPATLRLSVRPWGNVRIDGRDLGTTPIAPITLAPGAHVVIVRNEERQADRTLRIQLAPGESRLVQVDLTTAM